MVENNKALKGWNGPYRKGGRPGKLYLNPKIYKKSKKCPCGKRLTKQQKTFCSKECSWNIFYGNPQYRPKVIEYYFPKCGHTRLVSDIIDLVKEMD